MSSAAPDLRVARPAEAEAAPQVADVTAGPGARRAVFSRRAPRLSHLPGEGGIVAGVSTLVEWTRRGAASMLDQRLYFGPVFRTQFGFAPVVAVSEPKLVLEVLRNDERAFSPALSWSEIFAGVEAPSPALDLPGTPEYAHHADARDVLEAGFTPAAVSAYADVAAPLFDRAVEVWAARGRVPFKAEIRRLLGKATARAFLGLDDPRDGLRFETRLASFGYDRLRDGLRRRLADRRDVAGDDLFGRLCAASRRDRRAGEDALVRLFIAVMGSAFDTAVSGLSGMAYLLARHPEWQERLRAEVRALGRHPSYEEALGLEGVERVWRETLRLFPVTSIVPRAALRQVSLGSWRIPAGAVVFALVAPALRACSWWRDPEHFDPDRFSPVRAEDRKYEALFDTFAARGGLGMRLADALVRAFWVSMLPRASFRLERPYEARHTMIPVGVVSGDVALALGPA
jgi:cytochrome P450